MTFLNVKLEYTLTLDSKLAIVTLNIIDRVLLRLMDFEEFLRRKHGSTLITLDSLQATTMGGFHVEIQLFSRI